MRHAPWALSHEPSAVSPPLSHTVAVGLSQWMQVFDTVSNLAQLTGRFRRPEAPGDPLAQTDPAASPLGQIETRLTGVVVAALREAFDRDRARMDLERTHLEAERQRADAALRAELARQAADRALSRIRVIAIMTIGVWMLSAALGVWLPGMRGGSARWVLGAGWTCVLASLGASFSAWQAISQRGESGARSTAPGLAETSAPWLLLVALALCGAALLMAL
jgi:hypothetical protein